MKINGKEIITNGKFAYDGCHKIYILEDEQDEKEAIECGYHIYDIVCLESAYENSCDLRFIDNWKLNTTYVAQFEDAKFED
jgi:hypothetical protein